MASSVSHLTLSLSLSPCTCWQPFDHNSLFSLSVFALWYFLLNIPNKLCKILVLHAETTNKRQKWKERKQEREKGGAEGVKSKCLPKGRGTVCGCAITINNFFRLKSQQPRQWLAWLAISPDCAESKDAFGALYRYPLDTSLSLSLCER